MDRPSVVQTTATLRDGNRLALIGCREPRRDHRAPSDQRYSRDELRCRRSRSASRERPGAQHADGSIAAGDLASVLVRRVVVGGGELGQRPRARFDHRRRSAIPWRCRRPAPRSAGPGSSPGFRSCRPSGCRRRWRSRGSCRPAPYAAPWSQGANATPCRAWRFPRPPRSAVSCRQTLATVRAMATRLVGVASSTRRSNAHSHRPSSCSSAAVRKCSPGMYMTT